jgi:cobalt-zinc-cadmium efflux system protein
VLALALDLAIVACEVTAGVVAHSAGLLADAGHDAADAGGLLLGFGALRLAGRSPTARRSFGFHRATIVSALANDFLVLAVAAIVVVESVTRLVHPGHVDGLLVAVVAGGAAVANAAAALVMRDHSHDLGMRAAALHLAGDAATSLGVALVGVVVLTTGRFAILYPVAALVIAILVAGRGWQIARESVDILLEATPGDLDLTALRATITAVPGVCDVHDLHCWSLSSEMRALSAHLVLNGHPTLEQAQLVGDHVKSHLGSPYAIAHATLELECESCVDPDGVVCPIDSESGVAPRSFRTATPVLDPPGRRLSP